MLPSEELKSSIICGVYLFLNTDAVEEVIFFMKAEFLERSKDLEWSLFSGGKFTFLKLNL